MNIQKLIIIFFKTIFSTRAAGVYLLLFACTIGVATFVENDFGTSSAQEVIFKTKWFELLLVLFGCTIMVNIFRFRMIEHKKWASLCFHLSIIIIIAGAGITRYFGYEGMMHIREGATVNRFLSSEPYLKFSAVYKGKAYSFDENTHFSSLGGNKFEELYQIGPHVFQVKLNKFIPNPIEKLTEDDKGNPILKVVIAGMKGREEYFVQQGDRVNINGVNYNFTDEILPNAFNIQYRNDSLYFKTDVAVSQMVMATQKSDSLYPGFNHPLMLRSMYTMGKAGFVFGDFKKNGKLATESSDPKMKNESNAGLIMAVTHDGDTKETMITGRKGDEGQPRILDFPDIRFSMAYGAKHVTLPFAIKCRDFIMDRYPGTDNPSSYASEVTLIDQKNGINQESRIFMNNILDYGGFRFFQSSFDQDELGTYLSVNHDFWGTWVSYIGYIFLTIGLIMIFFSKNTRFAALLKKLDHYQSDVVKTASVILIIMLTSLGTLAISQETQPAIEVSKKHAAHFGKLLVQDHRGRFKPVNTLTGELLRKVAKKEGLYGQTSDQVILSMLISPAVWENVPLIHIGSHPEVQKLLHTSEKLVPYSSFFDTNGQYVLRDMVRNAQSVNPKDHGTFEKTIIKLDEKVNIISMVFSGRLLKVLPVENDPANTWISPMDIREMATVPPDLEAENILFSNYLSSLPQAKTENDWTKSDELLDKISDIQLSKGAHIIPSGCKIQAELWLNSLDVFGKLRNIYGALSFIILGIFFYSIFSPRFIG